jgi:hypothetical protein
VPSLAPGTSVNVSVSLDPTNDPKAWMGLMPGLEETMAASFKPDAKKLVQAKFDQASTARQAWRATYLTGVVNLQAALKQPPFVYKVAYQTSCFANKQGCLVQ